MIDPKDIAFASAYNAALRFVKDRFHSDVRFYRDELAEELTKRGCGAEYVGQVILQLVSVGLIRRETSGDRVDLRKDWQFSPTTTAEPRWCSYNNNDATETAGGGGFDAAGAMIIVRYLSEIEAVPVRVQDAAVDLQDYATATEIRTKHTPPGVAISHKQLLAFLAENKGIRMHHPRKNRLSVHLSDWIKHADELRKWFAAKVGEKESVPSEDMLERFAAITANKRRRK